MASISLKSPVDAAKGISGKQSRNLNGEDFRDRDGRGQPCWNLPEGALR